MERRRGGAHTCACRDEQDSQASIRSEPKKFPRYNHKLEHFHRLHNPPLWYSICGRGEKCLRPRARTRTQPHTHTKLHARAHKHTH